MKMILVWKEYKPRLRVFRGEVGEEIKTRSPILSNNIKFKLSLKDNIELMNIFNQGNRIIIFVFYKNFSGCQMGNRLKRMTI